MQPKRTTTAKWSAKEQRWRISVQKDGLRKVFTSSVPGRRGQIEANGKADAWLESDVVSSGQRVSVLWADYMAHQRATTGTANVQRLENMGSNYILPLIGHLRIEAVTQAHLQKIVDEAYQKGSLKKGKKQRRPASLPLSRKTLQILRSTIRSFFKYCRMAGVTSLNPESLTIPQSARLKGKTILQPESLSTLFSVDTTIEHGKRIKDQYIYAYRFQVACGLRPGELAGLQVGDVSPDTGQVHIRRAVNAAGETTTGKNENAIRSFVMPPRARQACLDQIAYLKEQCVPLHYNTPLFCIRSQHTYYGHWRRYLAANGLPAISPYELRHTFVSIAKFLPEGQVKMVVGHSKNMDTFGVYGHLLEGEADKTASDLGNIFEDILASNK